MKWGYFVYDRNIYYYLLLITTVSIYNLREKDCLVIGVKTLFDKSVNQSIIYYYVEH